MTRYFAYLPSEKEYLAKYTLFAMQLLAVLLIILLSAPEIGARENGNLGSNGPGSGNPGNPESGVKNPGSGNPGNPESGVEYSGFLERSEENPDFPERNEMDQGLAPVEYNSDQLVKMAVMGQIGETSMNYPPYRIGADGSLWVIPGTGSITYNFRTGDTAINLAGDHVEPAVTLVHPNGRASGESRGLNVLSCIGNEVRVISGEARGATGYVIGKHGGAEHVMVDFADNAVLDKLLLGDRMHIYAYGTGMELTNIDGVKAMNASPRLIEALTGAGMGITPEGKLRIGVAVTVPAKIMGSGLGQNHSYSGDYDIQLFDEQVVEKYNLNSLRFGDIVAIIDADSSYGRIFKTGAITIGVITHSGSIIAGHGPGVATLFTSTEGLIEPVIDVNANLKYLLFE